MGSNLTHRFIQHPTSGANQSTQSLTCSSPALISHGPALKSLEGEVKIYEFLFCLCNAFNSSKRQLSCCIVSHIILQGAFVPLFGHLMSTSIRPIPHDTTIPSPCLLGALFAELKTQTSVMALPRTVLQRAVAFHFTVPKSTQIRGLWE